MLVALSKLAVVTGSLLWILFKGHHDLELQARHTKLLEDFVRSGNTLATPFHKKVMSAWRGVRADPEWRKYKDIIESQRQVGAVFYRSLVRGGPMLKPFIAPADKATVLALDHLEKAEENYWSPFRPILKGMRFHHSSKRTWRMVCRRNTHFLCQLRVTKSNFISSVSAMVWLVCFFGLCLDRRSAEVHVSVQTGSEDPLGMAGVREVPYPETFPAVELSIPFYYDALHTMQLFASLQRAIDTIALGGNPSNLDGSTNVPPTPSTRDRGYTRASGSLDDLD